MKPEQARTGYSQQIDVTDPKWRKARESLWRKEIARHHKGDGLPYTHTEQYKRVFMGEIDWVTEGTDLTYIGVGPDSARCLAVQGTGWEMSPFQNRNKWRWAIVDCPPESLFEKELFICGHERLIEYRLSRLSYIGQHLFIFTAGWDHDLGAFFSEYILGSRYQAGEREFEGHKVSPLLSPSYFFVQWLDSVSGSWLGCRKDSLRTMATSLTDYFFSILDFVHPVFFSGKRSAVMSDEPIRCLSMIRRMANIESVFSVAMDFDDRDLSESNLKCRRDYIDYFSSCINKLSLNHPFRLMWEASIGKPLISSPRKYAESALAVSSGEEPEFLKIGIGYEHCTFKGTFIPPYLGDSF